MFETMTTGEKALIGATAIGIAALVFHKPTRNAVGLSDGRRRKELIELSHIRPNYINKKSQAYETKRKRYLIENKLPNGEKIILPLENENQKYFKNDMVYKFFKLKKDKNYKKNNIETRLYEITGPTNKPRKKDITKEVKDIIQSQRSEASKRRNEMYYFTDWQNKKLRNKNKQ